MIRRWKELDFEIVHQGIAFDLCAKTLAHPLHGHSSKYYFFRCTDWVNVIPITSEKEVVLVKQWRHGADAESLEIPGGMLDSQDEEPKLAALRELEEETGHTSNELISLGSVSPNPAIQENRCHFFVALNSTLKGKQNLDLGEDIEVIYKPLVELPHLIESGEIYHALAVCGIYRFLVTKTARDMLNASWPFATGKTIKTSISTGDD